MAKKVVLITGASSGIGRALARKYAEEGHHLLLLARREDELKLLANRIGALAVVGDVCKPQDLENAVTQARERFGRLDLLIANAGFGVAGRAVDLSTEDYRRQFEVNVFGVLNTFYAGIEELKKSQGLFAITGSISSYVTTPQSTAYSMSKYAVRALAEGLRYELAETGVACSLIAPGFVESQIRMVNNQGQYKAQAKDPMPKWIVMSSKKAARQIYRGLEKRKPEIVITWHGKFFVFIGLKVRWLMHWLFPRIGEKRRKGSEAYQ